MARKVHYVDISYIFVWYIVLGNLIFEDTFHSHIYIFPFNIVYIIHQKAFYKEKNKKFKCKTSSRSKLRKFVMPPEEES